MKESNNKSNRVKKNKTCNYCMECEYNYPLDIQFCPKCHNKLIPIPYSNIDKGGVC